MSAIAKAIGPLVNIALLLLFAIIIFAIIGLEFYAGALNKTCYDIQNLGEKMFFLWKTRKVSIDHRRRIYTEEKAKVVAADWGTELRQFLAALAILHQDDLKNTIICTRAIWRLGWFASWFEE